MTEKEDGFFINGVKTVGTKKECGIVGEENVLKEIKEVWM